MEAVPPQIIVKVKIKNFQSIENCEFDIPEKSFTCIVGPSNIGKSAIRRALCCLLYNDSDASYIRKGTKECSVEILFEDGLKIRWFRSESNSGCYEINGEVFNKLNKSIPKPILDKGFKELILSKDKVNVQIASQFSNIFLLNDSGSRVTEVFSNLGNLNRIITASKACSYDLKNNKNKISVRKEDLVLIKEKIKSFKNLDETVNSVEIIKSGFDALKKLKEKLGILRVLNEKLLLSIEYLKLLRPLNNISIESFDIDLNKFFNIKNLNKKYEVSFLKNEFYEKLRIVKEIEFSLDKDYEKYLKILKSYYLYVKSEKKIQAYSCIKEFPEINITLEKYSKLKEVFNRVFKAKNSIIDMREKLNLSENKLIELKKEEKELHKQIKVCPFCEKKFDV